MFVLFWLAILFRSFCFTCSHRLLNLFGFPSVLDEGESRNTSCGLHLISTYLLLSLGRCLSWWNPRVSSAKYTLTWFISEIYFVNNDVIITTHLSQAYAAVNLNRFWLSYLNLWYSCCNILKHLKKIYIIWVFNLLTLSVRDEGYSRKRRARTKSDICVFFITYILLVDSKAH